MDDYCFVEAICSVHGFKSEKDDNEINSKLEMMTLYFCLSELQYLNHLELFFSTARGYIFAILVANHCC